MSIKTQLWMNKWENYAWGKVSIVFLFIHLEYLHGMFEGHGIKLQGLFSRFNETKFWLLHSVLLTRSNLYALGIYKPRRKRENFKLNKKGIIRRKAGKREGYTLEKGESKDTSEKSLLWSTILITLFKICTIEMGSFIEHVWKMVVVTRVIHYSVPGHMLRTSQCMHTSYNPLEDELQLCLRAFRWHFQVRPGGKE